MTLRRRDLRIDPRTWKIEVVAGGGQHGMTFDAWGERFVCSNSDHLRWIAYEPDQVGGSDLLTQQPSVVSIADDGPSAEVYRISPIEPWRIVRTRLRLKGFVPGPVEGGGRAAGYFTSATGITMYRGDRFGPEAQQKQFAFVGDVGGNLVHRKEIRWQDSSPRGYRVDLGREFLASRDNWFRPVQFLHGPDGALYVLDMYREVIEHPLSLPPVIKRHLDLTRGRDRGRIYRIVANAAPTRDVAAPWPGTSSSIALVTVLDHPNGWHRETAARILLARNDQEVIPALRNVVVSGQPFGRMHALHLLHDFGALHDDELIAACADENTRVAAHAVRLVGRGDLLDRTASARALSQARIEQDRRLAHDVLLASRRLDRPQRKSLWLRIAEQGTDGDARIERALLAAAEGIEWDIFPALSDVNGLGRDLQELASDVARPNRWLSDSATARDFDRPGA